MKKLAWFRYNDTHTTKSYYLRRSYIHRNTHTYFFLSPTIVIFVCDKKNFCVAFYDWKLYLWRSEIPPFFPYYIISTYEPIFFHPPPRHLFIPYYNTYSLWFICNAQQRSDLTGTRQHSIRRSWCAFVLPLTSSLAFVSAVFVGL